MAAPTVTVRQTPSGSFLEDGFSSKITFARDPDVSLWEKTVKPPGVDGGDAIELQTMHSLVWREKGARQLKTMTDNTFTAAYDPKVKTQLVELINQPGSITVLYPDGSTESYFGFLKSADFSDLKEGEFPEATCTIVPTNRDPVNRVEAGPVIAEVAGT